MKLTAIFLAPFIVLLTGCASQLNTADSGEFACPGMPGVMCKTPFQVYKMTNGDTLDVSALDPLNPKNNKTVSLAHTNPAAPISDATPMPIREPAKVMRIWIAPWSDKNDDLHWTTYVYTEIQKRTWSFGNPDFKEMAPVIPYKSLTASMAQPPAEKKQNPSHTKHNVTNAALPPSTENP